MFINVNDNEMMALALFTKGYNRRYYIREVAKLMEVSSRTALVTLDKLEERGVLKSEKRGKIKEYSIRKSLFSREFFVLAEQYKKVKFLKENPVIMEVLEKIDGLSSGILVVFGSHAKGIAKDGSDLDLFVVGEFDEKKIRKAGKTYGIKMEIKSYPMKTLEKKMREDPLLKEIAQNHILIKNVEGFVGRAVKWTK